MSSLSNVAIYVVNPNSSSVITHALSISLSPQTPPGCTSNFVTGPPTCPESIQDISGSIISAAETYKFLVSSSPNLDLNQHSASAFLVACFSDHPLVGILRQKVPNKPSIHLLEAAIIHALSVGTKFGVLTTGKSVVSDVEAGVRKVMGGHSDRYVGTHATGLGVVELQTGNRAKVEGMIKKGAQDLVRKGADVIILGCAGMTGMEGLVREACDEVGEENVAVIDGAKAGMQILAGLARVNYRA
ncbi:related to DCG1 - involved in nitrogen-catabolite metabolism [Melanopsichium pennsylvanicum]|uniref:Related to DCG1 - involved in nitrogen-catabolite metabolism n=1 Tax=Melanopsichium pennsylvanicum TaxID=63383 RepID=A0AAJ4XM89_9BASI|nr:related to DCG1 - involved in nitrogen-catabolite metabolism [Melanopsichium pennsylvanicum]